MTANTASLAQFGIDFLANFSSVRTAGKLAAARDRVAASQAEAANTVRLANNELKAAQGGLARTIQGIQNARLLRYGGEVQAALGAQAGAVVDAAARGQLERKLSNIEELGAASARAAAAGISGGAVDALRDTLSRRQARGEQEAERVTDRSLFALNERQRRAARDTVEGLNSDLVLESLDYTVNTTSASSYADSGVFSQLLQALARTGTKRLANGLSPNDATSSVRFKFGAHDGIPDGLNLG